MAVNIRMQGKYELFCTPNDNQILRLDDDYFALIMGNQGEILVGSDADHKKARTLMKGKYKLVDFDNDAKFKDMPHLFLEDGGKYRDNIVPRGLPSKKGDREKIVRTDETFDVDELESYFKSPKEGPGQEGMGRPGGKSASNITYHLRGTDFPATKRELLAQARENDAPDAVLEQLGKLKDVKFKSMADMGKGLGEAVKKERPPIEDYEGKSAREVLKAMNDLDREGIEKVRDFEEGFYGRKTVLRKANQLLEREEAPVEAYFDLTAREVIEKAKNMDEAELKELKSYEQEHKGRKSVIEKIDRQLRH